MIMNTILLLHTDDLVRSTIGTVLEQEDFAAIWAHDAEMAISKIRALRPQLVLIDLPVAGISGLLPQMRGNDKSTSAASFKRSRLRVRRTCSEQVVYSLCRPRVWPHPHLLPNRATVKNSPD